MGYSMMEEKVNLSVKTGRMEDVTEVGDVEVKRAAPSCSSTFFGAHEQDRLT